MNIIKTWGTGIAAACIVAAVITFLLPEKHFKKAVGAAMSAFFITVIISPFLNGKNLKIKTELSDITYNTLNYESYDEYLISSRLTAASEAVEEAIVKTLNNKNVPFKEVAVTMNITDGNSIVIKSVNITTDNGNESEIKKVLKDELELEAVVSKNG